MAQSFVGTLQNLDRASHLHPFTEPCASRAGTHIILKGEGCYFVDESGRRILDGLAGLWCVNVGYSSKAIVQAVTHQLEQTALLPLVFQFNDRTPDSVGEVPRREGARPGQSYDFFEFRFRGQ